MSLDPSLLTPTIIGSVSAAFAAVIGALSTATIAVLREIRSTKNLIKGNAQVGAAVGEERDRKLDRIEVLVNGRYSEVLQELATVRQAIADASGRSTDKMLADRAQQRADEQHARVRELASRGIKVEEN